MTTVSALKAILQASRCPYALGARIDVSPLRHFNTNASEIVANELPHVRRYLGALPHSLSDGYALEVATPEFGSEKDRFARNFAKLLDRLAIALGDGPLRREHVMGPGWWLRLSGLRHFALAFAPCYPPENSRSTCGGSSTFVIFQPVESFERAARDRVAIDDRTRRLIRRAYAKSGRPYSARIAASEVEAPKFLMSLDSGDRPVEWWHHLEETPLI